MAVTRRLVTVRRITKVIPIPGTIFSTVIIDGWRAVVNSKEEFKENQLVVYIEVDSFLPDNSYFWDFCVKSKAKLDGEPGFLVRTVMKGNRISQGLVFRVEMFSEITSVFNELKSKHRYDKAVQKLMDMSFEKELGVKKWEVPPNDGRTMGPAPVFFPQPGCNRAQNIVKLFDEGGTEQFQVTEKLDGHPMTVYCVDKDSEWNSTLPPLPKHLQQNDPMRIGITNRQNDLMEHEDSWFWTTAKRQGILDKIREVSKNIKNVAIQGELCGSSIYTNSMGFEPGDHHFYAFDIFDIDRQKYLKPYRVKAICKLLQIDHTPIINDQVELHSFAKDMDDLIAKAEGFGLLGMPREGLVFKEIHGGFSFKAISNTWLLLTGKGQ